MSATTDQAKAARRAAIAQGAARAARHQYLLTLATRHSVELPPMPVGDDDAVSDACAVLEQAGAVIDWTLIELPNPTERRNTP